MVSVVPISTTIPKHDLPFVVRLSKNYHPLEKDDLPCWAKCDMLMNISREAELKRKGVTYAQLAEKLSGLDIYETERNLNNKISRGGFSAAFLLQCLGAIGSRELRLD
ncbi:DUF6471 domain-containing protein [Hoeflea sp. YIM 152468]|uniref:DUF6471 domain-containing protein n=1 Tax=Hoeflea sp. YIM 152468 TaxID=3031759 RepID=UPI0023DB12C7|nr:DUF6471 domain-containing protein [Hoeflea sp. YIM 152468]MDF1608491.1 DUF6471 domain-containing protein [Hoeflea sp. YIM 152468]